MFIVSFPYSVDITIINIIYNVLHGSYIYMIYMKYNWIYAFAYMHISIYVCAYICHGGE